jgi:hypothetical protein
MTSEITKDPVQSTLEAYPEHVKAIGMISIENGNMEQAMVDLFAKVLFISVRVAYAIYLTPKSALARIEIFENASKAALSPATKNEDSKAARNKQAALIKILRLAQRARKFTFKRHSIIHDTWGVNNGVVHRYITGSPSLEKVTVSLAELNALVRSFRQLTDDIEALTAEFRERPPRLSDMRKS